MKYIAIILFSLLCWSCEDDSECVAATDTPWCIDFEEPEEEDAGTVDSGADAGLPCWTMCPCEFDEDPSAICIECKNSKGC